MSAFKGTPGPWEATESGGYVRVASANGVGLFFENVAHPGATEDAQLIAAAPDLLEACQALMDATNEDGMTNSMLLGCAIEMAGNAISKATGGAA